MLISMTGFGEGRSESDTITVVAEVRTINNRHLKLSYRASEGYQGLEPRVESLVRDRILRGSVQLNVRVERRAATSDYRLDPEVLTGYQKQLAEVDPQENVPLGALLGLPGVVAPPADARERAESDWPTVEAALNEAFTQLTSMRRREGEALDTDLRSNSQTIAAEVERIAQRSPELAEQYRERLHERVGQVLEKHGVSLEPNDLVREVALYVDRSDIAEELVRLRSHLQQFEATLAQGENIGRKLEFILQEMGRETNTIGSKASDSEISARVVEIKTMLERIREQVQNVE